MGGELINRSDGGRASRLHSAEAELLRETQELQIQILTITSTIVSVIGVITPLLLVVSSRGGCVLIIDGFQIKRRNTHVSRTVTVLLPDLHDTFPGRHGAGGRNPQEAGETHSSKASNFFFFFIHLPLALVSLQLRQNRCRAETRRQFTGARSPAPLLSQSAVGRETGGSKTHKASHFQGRC